MGRKVRGKSDIKGKTIKKDKDSAIRASIKNKLTENEVQNFNDMIDSEFVDLTKKEIKFLFNDLDVNHDSIIFENKAEIIVFNHDNQKMILDDLDNQFKSVKTAEDWFWDKDEWEIEELIGFKEVDLWDEIDDSFVVFHATDTSNIDSILKDGLLPSSETRSISNRDIGQSVFTSENKENIDTYGDSVFEIKLGQMGADGIKPSLTLETPVEESEKRELLAHKIGIFYEPEFTSEGVSNETIVVYGEISPKYLRLLD